MDWLPWLLFPALGACIGYVTNWLAIKMLFHPRQATLGFHGLIPRRQKELSQRIGDVVGEDVIQMDDLLKPLRDADVRPLIEGLIEEALAKKIKEWQQIPLVGAFITEDRVQSIRESIVDEVIQNQDSMLDRIGEFATEYIDIKALAAENIEAFDLDRLEEVTHQVAKTEFRAIEIWGAVLGALIGIAQAALLYFMALGG
ncbi:MAG: DUF445 family protein [Planctomycetes bacterium]|nr:DUF445 family protein [Planctomycetota bacterium]